MQLTLEQVRDITCGAVSVEQEADGIHFYRFTPEQMALYRLRSHGLYRKALTTAGVRLQFRTDSTWLKLGGEVFGYGGNRRYYAIDICVDGKRVDDYNNYENVQLTLDYTGTNLPLGEFGKTVQLGRGEKEVSVFLPWNLRTVFRDISLEDGAMLEPVKPSKKLVCFGDSISQGYDAMHPVNRYTSMLADWLDAEEYNKAIGSEIFFPELAEAPEAFVPDYITVAYGTNDWCMTTFAVFRENCRQFYENLSRTYKNSRIFAITPIWRKNQIPNQDFPSFGCIEEWIREVAAGLPNVTVISGYDLVPHDVSYYADLTLHPNDRGFAEFFEGLKKEIARCK